MLENLKVWLIEIPILAIGCLIVDIGGLFLKIRAVQYLVDEYYLPPLARLIRKKIKQNIKCSKRKKVVYLFGYDTKGFNILVTLKEEVKTLIDGKLVNFNLTFDLCNIKYYGDTTIEIYKSSWLSRKFDLCDPTVFDSIASFVNVEFNRGN